LVAASISIRLIRRPAIQRHGQDSGHGCLADAPMPAENIPMRRSTLLNGIFQRLRYMLLPDDLGEV
jgi:hypothetical protein